MMSDNRLPTSSPSSDTEVAEFVRKVRSLSATTPNRTGGRLIFALDATASRQPTWDQACQLQGEMFVETAAIGGLNIQLVWYRGFGEFYGFTSGHWGHYFSPPLDHNGQIVRGKVAPDGDLLMHALALAEAFVERYILEQFIEVIENQQEESLQKMLQKLCT